MTLISRVNRISWGKRRSPKGPDQVRFDRLAKLCESPIERLFWQTGYKRLSRMGHFTPQQKIGPYRADFVLTDIPGVPLLNVVIELYGYKYHSTPEQVTRDAERVRALQRARWQVVIFWGFEINGNCMACVRRTEFLVREWSKWLRC